MNFDKKYIAGIAAVAIAGVYAVRRWRSGSSSGDADEEPPGFQSPCFG
jgi:hypothetical protein